MTSDEQYRKPDQTHLAAWRGLLNAHSSAINAIERDLARAGQISLAWYDVLVAIQESPEERVRLHELADRVVLSRSGLSRLVDRLVGAGLIERQPCPDDRRGAFAVLTPDGAAAILQTWPVYAAGIVEHFARFLDHRETTLLVDLLGKVQTAEPSG